MITRESLKAIRADINAALALVMAKHGLSSLGCDGGRYNSENFTLKVAGVAQGGDSKEVARYKRYMPLYRLPPLGTIFSSEGMSHTIIGLSTRNSVYTTRSDGRRFRFKLASVLEITGSTT